MSLFKCKHPAHHLAVERKHTSKKVDADFLEVTYHLFCRSCGEKVTIVHAECIGGTKSFLSRKQAEVVYIEINKMYPDPCTTSTP